MQACSYSLNRLQYCTTQFIQSAVANAESISRAESWMQCVGMGVNNPLLNVVSHLSPPMK